MGLINVSWESISQITTELLQKASKLSGTFDEGICISDMEAGALTPDVSLLETKMRQIFKEEEGGGGGR